MDEQAFQQAIHLHVVGRYKEAQREYEALLVDDPHDALLHYRMAWVCDNLGEESRAVPHYERALEGRLSGEDREGAFIGLGSTYRCLGDYERAEQLLRQGIREFPHNNALYTFPGLTLHNQGRSSEGIKILLEILAETSQDENILTYKKAILFYSDKLEQVW
ncbi:tetratricopeptide repeat protein [Mechercharimyces sp. CAU 1602]|uniref:tetratricopeptide repeat protein n=1 Tax=Mechercharimyces sp. CAU 1602 TaxID=2973933 RepID=UPI002162AC26|nr:tetratricopeptide repeat protein [Mechercharimyces sp. CAU 1602]MCS1350728.1 tetratricopeptide repeat protein [Mechercharimyces sp. CAU 1602]